jgi:ATP adenylyltransferase
METLWAPWRMAYIKNIDRPDPGCVFCTKPAATEDRENLILHRGNRCFVVMNLYPYNNGHLLIIPFAHVADICAIDTETSAEVWDLVCVSKKALTNAFHPDGFNIGINQGRSAGAGIDMHMHVHIVPRWNGDTNFMPVTGEVKVISQALHETYDALLPIFRSIHGTSSGAASSR